MRAFVILLLVVVTISPALSQTETEKLIEAEKTECLDREVDRLMPAQNDRSMATLTNAAENAAFNCRRFGDYNLLKSQTFSIVMDKLREADPALFQAQSKCLDREVDRLMQTHPEVYDSPKDLATAIVRSGRITRDIATEAVRICQPINPNYPRTLLRTYAEVAIEAKRETRTSPRPRE
jgi:hypothetical protein